MLRERALLFRRINVILDLVSTAVSLLLAFWLRYGLQHPVPYRAELFIRTLSILYFALPLWHVLFQFHGKYESHRIARPRKVAGIIARSVAEGIALLILISYFLKTAALSRSFLLLFGAVNTLLLICQEALLRTTLSRFRARGYNFRRVLIVGTGKEAVAVAGKIRDHQEWGLKVWGSLSPNPTDTGTPPAGGRVVGGIEDLTRILASNPIDEVHIALPLLDLASVGRILETCEEQGVRARVMIDLYSPTLSKIHLEDFRGTPMLTFTASPTESGQLFVKALLDRAGALLLLLLFLPLLLCCAALIRLDSRGPVFFVQERVGLYKRRFRMYKFRTMIEEAEGMKGSLLNCNERTGPVFKMRNDPRCTRVGRLLRKLSLDELPQLLNVLKGEMSFIGPRPPVPDEVARYQPWQHRRLSMKPGISGLWQVSGRCEQDFRRCMELDLRYIDNWSLKLDLVILLKTFPAVLFGRGAS
jgi:exopolysaccharide biosynthesis polyprenyl glycosylphosphotransferase